MGGPVLKGIFRLNVIFCGEYEASSSQWGSGTEAVATLGPSCSRSWKAKAQSCILYAAPTVHQLTKTILRCWLRFHDKISIIAQTAVRITGHFLYNATCYNVANKCIVTILNDQEIVIDLQHRLKARASGDSHRLSENDSLSKHCGRTRLIKNTLITASAIATNS